MRLIGNSKGVVTPGQKTKAEENDETGIDETEKTRYRAMSARANYLSQDRSDIQFATKRAMQRHE